MRVNISKRSSTKAERLFYEILKRNNIPFQHRVKIDGNEIDFIVGNYAIEIDGHKQSSQRNAWLILKGFNPVHYQNRAFKENLSSVEKNIIDKYVLYTKTSIDSIDRRSI